MQIISSLTQQFILNKLFNLSIYLLFAILYSKLTTKLITQFITPKNPLICNCIFNHFIANPPNYPTAQMTTSQFGRYSPNTYTTTNSYSNNTVHHNTYNNYRSNSNNFYQGNNAINNTFINIGSYRIRNYDSQKMTSSMTTFEQWKQSVPLSITLRQQTIHLTPIQLRAQDYYLIRNKYLEERHRKNLQLQWINKNIFNTNLFSKQAISTIRQVLSFKESPPTFDTILNMSKGAHIRYGNNYGNSNNYGIYNQNNNNNNTIMLNNGINNNNPFTNNNIHVFANNTINSNNPFSSNNNNNSSISNPFNNNNNNTFNNKTVNNNNNNPFNSNNSNMNGSRNVNAINGFSNMISNNNTINSSNSPFNNNNFSSNLQTKNNNNNNNQFITNGNPPRNTNTSNSLTFNNSNTNSFNNNTNNVTNPNNTIFPNNTANRLFTPNTSLTNNTNNNNNSFINPNQNNNQLNTNNKMNNGACGIISEYTILQMMYMMQTCINKVLANNSTEVNRINNGILTSDNEQLFGIDHINDIGCCYGRQNSHKKYEEWFKEPYQYGNTSYGIDEYMHAKAKNRKKNNNKNYVVINDISNSRNINNNNERYIISGSLMHNNHNHFSYENNGNSELWGVEGNRVWDNSNHLVRNNLNNGIIFRNQYNKLCIRDSIEQKQQSIDDKEDENNENHKFLSLINSSSNYSPNFHPTIENSLNNSSKNSINKLVMNEQNGISNKMNKQQRNSSFIPNETIYKYQIECIWAEKQRKNQNKQKMIKKVDGFLIEGNVVIKNHQNLSELHNTILTDINNQIRNERKNNPHSRTEEIIFRKDATLTLQIPISISKNEYMIKGKLFQRKINVPKGYDYIYDNIQNWHVTNLTIANKFGRIHWPGIINIKGSDFQNQVEIMQNQGDVSGVLDNYDMIVTFNSLPSGVAMDSHDEIRAKKQMDRHIKKANDTTNDRITLIDLNLKNKSYTFKVCKNKNLEYGNRQNNGRIREG